MDAIIIKQARPMPRETKLVRAYEPVSGQPDRSLGVSASTTGNIEWAVLNCAAKAFLKFTEPQAEREEIETRISLKTVVADMIWRAKLTPKNVCFKPAKCHCPACWLDRQPQEEEI